MKPWLEHWEVERHEIIASRCGSVAEGVFIPKSIGHLDGAETIRLAAAAPAMARALCEVEWRGFAVDEANVCPARGCRGEEKKHPHSPDCALDAALTAAGLDAAAREEVRREK